MGLMSFLCWVWSSNNGPLRSSSLSTPLLPAASVKSVNLEHLSSPIDPMPSPRRMTFTLPSHIYSWLEAMAIIHNYGSVHKSIRDLLAWASKGATEDMEWLFGSKHEIPCQTFVIESCEASVIAGTQCNRGPEAVIVDATLSKDLTSWIASCVDTFALPGPSAVLDTVCRCAIELGAADDVFESDESGHDLPATTAQLYHDLGIITSSHHLYQS